MEKERVERTDRRNRKSRKKVCAFCMDKIEHIDYKDVPRLLKEKVKEILIDSGFEELVTDNSEK